MQNLCQQIRGGRRGVQRLLDRAVADEMLLVVLAVLGSPILLCPTHVDSFPGMP